MAEWGHASFRYQTSSIPGLTELQSECATADAIAPPRPFASAMTDTANGPGILRVLVDGFFSSYRSHGLLSTFASLPATTMWATSQVPSLVVDLNSVAFFISCALVLLATPVVIATLLHYVWMLRSIGPARKTLSTVFIVLLWPIVPLLCSVGAALIWSVLALGVMAFIVLLPPVATIYATGSFIGTVQAWRENERQNTQHLVAEDITFLELGIALVVAAISLCTTAPLVALFSLIKSPFLFLAVVGRTSYSLLKALFKCVCECRGFAWLAIFVPPLFALCLVGIVVIVALCTAASVLAKVVASVLWPGYVACGMLRSLGTRRERRGCSTILLEAAQAAYQVLWVSDIITNVWILFKDNELIQRSVKELVELASGERRELSHEVQCLSFLPPVVIGTLRQDGGWRVDLERIAKAVHMEPDVLEMAWTSFFQQMNAVGKRMMDKELLTPDYVSECPMALLIGLPALVVLEAIAKSPRGKEALVLANGYTILPKSWNAQSFAGKAWARLMEAKRAHEAASSGVAPDIEKGGEMLEGILLSGGAPADELPPLLAAVVASAGDASLPPRLAAIHKPIYALVYEMAQQPVYKTQFNRAVYEPLVDYSRTSPEAANRMQYVPPAPARRPSGGSGELL